MIPLSFRKAARRLIFLHEQGTSLQGFYDHACYLINRADSMRRSEEHKPGHEEWCDFRASILVRWGLYWDSIWTDGRDPKIYFPFPREHYLPNQEEAISLLREVVGDAPRNGRS